MDIVIRGLSPEAVKMIERLKKEKGFRSRNEYIKSLLEDVSFVSRASPLLERLEKQLVANTFFMQECADNLTALRNLVEGLIENE